MRAEVRMHRLVLLCSLVLVLACGDKDDDGISDDPADSGSGDGAVGGDGGDSGDSGGATTTPDIHLSETDLSFGSVTVGDDASKAVTVSNTGDGTLHVTDVCLVDGTGPFAVDLPSAIAEIAPGTAAQFTVGFAPSETGTFADVVVVTSDDPDEPSLEITVSGGGSNL
jgi:hypothetical protein